MNEVGTYRKKPIMVEAVQWPCDLSVLEAWGCETASLATTRPWAARPDAKDPDEWIAVWNDPDSCWKEIPPGHWILKGPAEGDFYPCAPEVFADTYEEGVWCRGTYSIPPHPHGDPACVNCLKRDEEPVPGGICA